MLAPIVIPALGHEEESDNAVSPTCTETGLSDGKHCSICNKIIVEQKIIPALGHTEIIDVKVDAACETNGKTEGKHCSVCNKVLIKQEIIPASHVEVIDKCISNTCTTTGLTEGKHCSACNKVLIKQEIIPASHNVVIDEAVFPTCTKAGLTLGKHCSMCGEVFMKQEIVMALGHNEKIVAAVDPTCVKNGLTEGKHCSACNLTIIKQNTIPATGIHTYDSTKTCTYCGYQFFTEGLEYKLVNDAYYVSGIGTAIEIEIIIPSTYKGLPVTGISGSAFYRAELTSIIIPKSVTTIEQLAFFNATSLKSIIFGGTKAEWNAISKGFWWDEGLGLNSYDVYCTDGNISVSA